MIEREVDEAIEAFLQRVRRHLPEGFESEDLLQDLREHIKEALTDKIGTDSTKNQMELLEKVLNNIGEPEEIAEEFSQSQIDRAEQKTMNNVRFFAVRLIAFIIFAIPAAWYISNVVESLDFVTALVVMLVFAILEAIIRKWQTDESS